MDETWLYHYDRRQINSQCSGGIAAHPAPKKFREQTSYGKVLASIFWDQDGILLIDYIAAGRLPRRSCSCTTIPRLTGHLQPRRNWPICSSNSSITHPILQIWASRTTKCYWTEKTIERSPFFVRRGGHCCRGDLVGRTIFWIRVGCKSKSNGLNSVLSFVGSMLNKSRICLL